MSKLILVTGLPYSGARDLAKTFSKNPFHIEDIKEIYCNGIPFPKTPKDLKRYYYLSVISLIEHHLKIQPIVVVEGFLLTQQTRKSYITLAKKMNAEIEIHFVNPSLEWIKRNHLQTVKKHPSENHLTFLEIEKQAKSYLQLPTQDEGIEQIFHYSEEDF